MSITEKTLQLKQDFDDVYQSGQDLIVSNVTQMKLIGLNVFSKSEAVLNLDSATNLGVLCAVYGENNPNRNNTVEHLIINCPNQVTSMQQMLQCDHYNADNTLKRLTINFDTSDTKVFTNAFNNLEALEVIDGTPFSFIGVSSNPYAVINCFSGCYNLTDFRVVKKSILNDFTIEYSPNLSAETVQSIIDGLNYPIGVEVQTLTLHATVGGKLTDEQKAIITAKNWILVY